MLGAVPGAAAVGAGAAPGFWSGGSIGAGAREAPPDGALPGSAGGAMGEMGAEGGSIGATAGGATGGARGAGGVAFCAMEALTETTSAPRVR